MDKPMIWKRSVTIFCVSLATIVLQILITRIFSGTLYYHFAFACITLAMLGLTAGAIKVFSEAERFSPINTDTEISRYLSYFALTTSLGVFCYVIGPKFSDYLPFTSDAIPAIAILAGVILLIFAFQQGGVIIALLLTRFPAHTGRLYAFDLCGAACGCFVAILSLQFFDPITLIFLLSLGMAALGRVFLPATAAKTLRTWTNAAVLGLMLVSTAQLFLLQQGSGIKLSWSRDTGTGPLLFERWNAFSHITVKDDKLYGQGFGPSGDPINVKQYSLKIDADAATVITQFDGNVGPIGYLKDEVVNLGYQLRDIKKVAVIGVGGGRDILSALVFGAAHVTGIEMNPAIFEALTQAFGDFSGHLDKHPGVQLINAEARSFLTSHPERYDLIQVSLIDTWAAIAAGGLTLTENKLYTVNAWEDFLTKLTDDGMLVFVRWYRPESHRGEYYRLLSLAAESLKSLDPQIDVRRHLLAATADATVTLAVSRSPFSEAEVARFYQRCAEKHFTPILAPDKSTDPIAEKIANGQADASFYDHLPIDVTPSTDNRPFFFHMRKLGTEQESGINDNAKNDVALTLLFRITIGTVIVAGIFILAPLLKLYRSQNIALGSYIPHILYFSGIGLGFMLIEISQMQRLMIFLGHPVYGLSVVLFTLLLFSGIGSYTVKQIENHPAWLRPLLLCLVLAVTGICTPWVTSYVKYYDTAIRILCSIALLAPMSFFMGMMFPLGIRLNRGNEALFPWFWGINGATSVFASVAGMLISMEFSIGLTFWAGALCYLACLPITVLLAKKLP